MCNFDIYMCVYEQDTKRLENYKCTKNKIPSLQKFSSIDTINERLKGISINTEHKFNNEIIVNDKLKGKLGCNLSHQIIWLNHLNSDHDWVLILEDDTKVSVMNENELCETMEKIINYANDNNTHFIQLETRNHHIQEQLKQTQTQIENLFTMKPQCGTSAYLINKVAIRYILSLCPWNKYVDVYTSDINIITKLNSLCYINTIFKTLGSQRQIDKNSQLGSIIYTNK